MRYVWDYLKHFYLALVLLLGALALYAYFGPGHIVQDFETAHTHQITAYGFYPTDEYWHEEDRILSVDEGTIELLHGETTDGFVFLDEADRSRNLVLFFQFTAGEDTTRPYSVLKDNLILYQDGRELSDGGITNENDSKAYQDYVNNAVSFLDKGDQVIAARVIAYEPSGGVITVVINGLEYNLSDLIPIYEQEVADELRAVGELETFSSESKRPEASESNEVEEEAPSEEERSESSEEESVDERDARDRS